MRIREVERVQKVSKLGKYIRRAGYEHDYEFAAAIDQPPSTLSLIANKRVLPTRVTLALICELLQITPLAVYDEFELDLLGGLKPVAKRTRRRTIKRWRVEANIGKELFKRLKKALAKKGLTVTAWIIQKAVAEVMECEQGY